MNLRYCLIILILFVTTSVLARDPIPEWAKGAVWYQILPERFRNTNPYNDPTKERVVGKKVQDWQIHPWASDWYKLQIWEANRGLDFYDLVSDRRYGGDLLGVIEKLRYLKGLGVDVIYLNPVFESPSILKYDVSTFHHIDNNFGSDRDGDWDKINSEKEDPKTWTLTSADKVFLDLITKAHELGMKIVIEAQFNFCGREFWAFKDLEQKQQNSAYKDWFEVLNWDDPATPDTIEFEYKSWHNNKSMPVFKKDKTILVEPVKKYLFDVTRRWMDPNGDHDPLDGIDGWFINSAEEMSPEFWQEWHKLVKSINPQALTVAEFLSEAPAWIDENNFDVVTNYALASLMQYFFIDQNLKSGLSEFNEKLAKLRTAYPEERNLCLLNLIDSHRTNRLASMFTNSDESHNHDTISSNHHNYDPRKPGKDQTQMQKLLVIFQLTYVGAPMIFYGDESGMWGGANPDNIKPMLWKEFVYENETYHTIHPQWNDEIRNVFDPTLFRLYGKLNKIRHENPAIQKGDFTPTILDDQKGIYAYARKFENNEVVVFLNMSEKKQIVEYPTRWKNGSKVKELLNEKKYKIENGTVKLELDEKSGAILVKEK